MKIGQFLKLKLTECTVVTYHAMKNYNYDLSHNHYIYIIFPVLVVHHSGCAIWSIVVIFD